MVRPIDPEVKGRVLADLIAGAGVRETARKHSVSPSTVVEWRDTYTTAVEVLRTEKKQSTTDLLAEYVNESIVTFTAQARHFRDPGWLAQQSAQGLAILHGTHNDKILRLLYALRPTDVVDAASVIDGAAGPPPVS